MILLSFQLKAESVRLGLKLREFLVIRFKNSLSFEKL